MKTAGIVAEYNPFHNGHAYQIHEIKEQYADMVAVVMSGNFMQRGSPACFEKRVRTAAALAGGADLVVELPLPYAGATAERFAYGAVSIFNAMGCIDLLCFGSESGNLESLSQAAVAVDHPEVRKLFASLLREGITFSKARQQAVEFVFGSVTGSLLSEPNNNLGIEYLRQLIKSKSPIQPITATRHMAPHDSPVSSGMFASGSLLRSMLSNDRDISGLVPETAMQLYRDEMQKGRGPCNASYMERAVLSRLRRMSPEDFARLPDISEGLENRLYNAAQEAVTLDEFFSLAKTKRYTMARLRRLAQAAFLKLPSGLDHQPPPYIRILGFSQNGRELLKKAKQTCCLPLSSRLSRLEALGGSAAEYAGLEAAAADQYSLFMPRPLSCGYDFTAPIVIL